MQAPKETYRKFCKTEKDLPIFFQDWYLDAVCHPGTWDAAVSLQNGEIVAVMPYFLKQKWGFRYFTMPHFVKHLGPYIRPQFRAPKVSHSILQDLIQQLPKIDAFKQDFHPTLTNWLPFYWKGYQQTSRYIYILDLQPEIAEIRRNINRNMRRNIKKAEAKLTITDKFPLETFYAINKKSFKRQGVNIPYSFDLLKKHDKALQAHGARKIFYAVDEQKNIHSAAYLIWDQVSSYYHLSGDDPAFRSSGSGIFLIWKAIEYTKIELGLTTFDFEGSMMAKIEAIRRQFGAQQLAYSSVWKYHSRTYKLLDWLQEKLKKSSEAL